MALPSELCSSSECWVRVLYLQDRRHDIPQKEDPGRVSCKSNRPARALRYGFYSPIEFTFMET